MNDKTFPAWLYAGKRDPKRKPEFSGAYMVAEPLEPGENPADSSAYCIVGDSLPDLKREALRHFGIAE